MVKFYKPGKVVLVLNGRYAGRKGIIIKSNYESVKDRKYPHCQVVGLAKGPRKPTKRNIAKFQARIKKLESDKDKSDEVKLLKSFGVFIKTYNMSHLLATRYSVKEDFGITKTLENLEKIEKKIKDDKAKIENKEKNKKDEQKEEYQKELESLKNELGKDEDEQKKEVRKAKLNIGAEMYKRYMQGFNKGNKEEEKENQKNTEYLFKKLHF